MNYSEHIKKARLITYDEIEVVLTTGDPEYPGTALEVTMGDDELFHCVVDEDGTKQVMFYPQKSVYRLELSTLEAIVSSAKDKLRYIP